MSLRLRLIAWYVAAVGALGVAPYLSVVLADKGITDQQIAQFMAVLPVAALLAAPLWSFAADRFGHAHVLLTLTTVGVTVGMGMLAGTATVPLLAAGMVLYAVSRAPQVPIVDALTLQSLKDDGASYGRIRLWGSVAFLIVAFSAGWLRTLWAPAPLVMGALLLSLTIPVSRLLPRSETPFARPTLRVLMGAMARPSTIALALACVLQGLSLSFYNGFIGRHVETLGLSSTIIGTIAVVGVGVEVGVMAISPWLLQRVAPSRLLVVALLASVPRWLGTAWSTEAVPLVAYQALHGLSFGLFWVAADPAFAKHAPPSVARSAQSLLTATAFGIGPLLSLPLAWWTLASAPPAALYEVGAVASALGLLVLLPVAVRARSSQAD